ncbi:HET domain-containing protein [Colletotrichum truncatum]|uniref:HET domain-containing protein n=1 Tax=Colletotrichum truncatum TaxID=5467 RepID=A0ACC3YKM3_COLTU
MWLLNTDSLALQEFFHARPGYAILSHTWGDEEVTYQDILGDKSSLKDKAGYKKIRECCALARENGFQWVWIDTCCINKSSSAELSEAINSMFQWYREARVCYAYLIDVPSLHYAAFLAYKNLINTPDDQVDVFKEEKAIFMKSRWFTRGWTLQELLAPRQVLFYASDWSYIGTKDDLSGLIEEQTGISDLALGSDSLQGFPVRTKMQWAAGRQTTRVEDLAYCLLGIFDINMPLLYGEGNRAFRRLQEEILKAAEDYSLLAWASSRGSSGVAGIGSALAAEPNDFAALALNGGITIQPSTPESRDMYVHNAEIYIPKKYSWKKEHILDNMTMDSEHFLLRKQRRKGVVFQPPTMSARGILITLLTNTPLGEAPLQYNWLAWTLLNIDIEGQSYAVCIALREEGKPIGVGIKAARQRSKSLHLVPQEMLRTFRPMTLYLRVAESPTNQHWKIVDNVPIPMETEKTGLFLSERNNVAARITETFPRLMLERVGGLYNVGSAGFMQAAATILNFDPVWAFVICLEDGESRLVVLLGRMQNTTSAAGVLWHCDVLPFPGEKTPRTITDILLSQDRHPTDLLRGPDAFHRFSWGEVGAVVKLDKGRVHHLVEVTIQHRGVDAVTSLTKDDHEQEVYPGNDSIPTIEIDLAPVKST